MTSKETLKIIKTYNYWKDREYYMDMICTHPDYIEAKKHYEKAIDNIDKIQKDLEVLAILKTILNYSYLFMIKNEKDYIKVREWLEK